jgi:type I restriction-modification system DNA methylase subunit
MSEADVHFEFYRHLQNAIDEEPQKGFFTYSDVRAEYNQGISGRADIVVFNESDNPILVVEAKRPDGGSRDIDPYSPDVIRQAFSYAGELGAPYFATFNGERLVLFDAFEPGQTLLQRSAKSYDGITDLGEFAPYLLQQIADIHESEIDWDDIDKSFVQRIRSLHESVTPDIHDSLQSTLGDDDEFRGRFVVWASEQGVDYADADDNEQVEIEEEFAAQAAYLLINKIIFYKILENSDTYEDDVRALTISIHRVQEDLKDHFGAIVNDVDFEAVFEHDEIFDSIPLDPVTDEIRNFVIELEEQDLSQFDSDVIGQIYQNVIPEERRHAMGEYYTPPPVCEFITELVIKDDDAHILDPACGSGGFLISSYNRLGNLTDGNDSHQQIIEQLYGVDINRFPAHLSAINLAIRDLDSYTQNVNIEVSDFFLINPDTQRLGRETASVEGSDIEQGLVDEIGGFDALIGNPPYIRSKHIGDKERVREHLPRVNGEHLESTSDIYSYFITHGTEFLSDDGRVGFIVSDGWLQTKYGGEVQEFVLDNYVVEAVVKFDRQVFDDALVESNVLILQRETDEQVRNQNITRFVRFKQSMPMEDMVHIIEQDYNFDEMIRTDKYRVLTRKQEVLYDENKWSVFLLAPPTYFQVVDTDISTQFQDIADQTRANTSGKNSFFHIRENAEELGIEQYLSPLAKASGQIDRILFSEEDAEEWGILDVNDLIEEAKRDANVTAGETDQQVKQWLLDNGHESLVEYVESGEQRDAHTGRTCANRDVWFNLGELERTKVLFPRFTWVVFRAVWNEAMSAANDQFYNIYTDVDEEVLCGVLNSRLVWMFYELRGRVEGGQGMNRTEIKGYELDELPIPDIREMSDDDKQNIKYAFQDLIEHERDVGSEVSLEDQKEQRDALDRAVLQAVGLGDRVDEIRRSVEGLVEMRERGGGINTEVLVERTTGTTNDPEVIELPGVSAVRESTSIADFS